MKILADVLSATVVFAVPLLLVAQVVLLAWLWSKGIFR